MNYNQVLYWIRKSHGWIGLWGAIFGLLFGTSGIWLNHRATLKLPLAQERTNAQLELPDPAPINAKEMSAWLQQTLALPSPVNSVRVEPSKPLPWGERAIQPERWIFNFGGPDRLIQADYWRGNRSVGITTTANGFIATLTNMHKGTGMSIPWVLLIDSWAGSLLFLSVTGVLLWLQTNKRRWVGLGIFSAATLSITGLTLSSILN